MTDRRGLLAILVALLWLVSCSPTPQAELVDVAGELRALRLQLRSSTTAGPDVATGVANAMAPLREALQGLVATQREQERRHLQLTQEVQRWGHLVAESLAPAQNEEARLVAARLQELETKLKEQDQRHQEVEQLLGTALDRASEQLDQFLRRLPPRAAAEVPAVGGTESGVAPVAPSQGNVGSSPRQGRVWLWVCLLGLSLAASAVLFGIAWRVRGAAAGSAAPVGVGIDAPSHDGAAIAAPEPGADRLWAAAALLGEAVETLRARQQAENEVPVATRPNTLDDLSIEDLFVVEGLDEPGRSDEPELGAPQPAEPRAAAAPPRAKTAARMELAIAAPSNQSPKPFVPEEVTVRVRPKDGKATQHELLRILHGDPRILQRPAPRLEAQGGHLVVRFALLPGLPVGERSVLEQRLRDSVA